MRMNGTVTKKANFHMIGSEATVELQASHERPVRQSLLSSGLNEQAGRCRSSGPGIRPSRCSSRQAVPLVEVSQLLGRCRSILWHS